MSKIFMSNAEGFDVKTRKRNSFTGVVAPDKAPFKFYVYPLGFCAHVDY